MKIGDKECTIRTPGSLTKRLDEKEGIKSFLVTPDVISLKGNLQDFTDYDILLSYKRATSTHVQLFSHLFEEFSKKFKYTDQDGHTIFISSVLMTNDDLYPAYSMKTNINLSKLLPTLEKKFENGEAIDLFGEKI